MLHSSPRQPRGCRWFLAFLGIAGGRLVRRHQGRGGGPAGGDRGRVPAIQQHRRPRQAAGTSMSTSRGHCAPRSTPTCQLVKQQWDRMITDLVAGQYEMVVSSMSISARRKQQIDFTQAYYQTPAKFVARKDNGAFTGSLEATEGQAPGGAKADDPRPVPHREAGRRGNRGALRHHGQGRERPRGGTDRLLCSATPSR